MAYNEFKDGISKSSYYNFIVKRFSRVYPIYFVLTFVYIALGTIFTQNKTNLATILVNITLFQNVLYVKNIIPLAWSLSVEWIIYFLLPFMFILSSQIKDKFRIGLLYIISICIMGFLSNIGSLFSDRERGVLSGMMVIRDIHYISGLIAGYESLLRGICSYLLGIVAFSLLSKHYFNHTKNIFFYLLFIIQLLLLFTDSVLGNITFILLVPITLVGLTRKNSLLSKFFSTKIVYFFGEISFSLYLIHYVFVMSVSTRLELFLQQNNVYHYKYLVFISILFSVIAISYILYYYLEKPLNNYFRKRLAIKPFTIKIA